MRLVPCRRAYWLGYRCRRLNLDEYGGAHSTRYGTSSSPFVPRPCLAYADKTPGWAKATAIVVAAVGVGAGLAISAPRR